MPTMASAPNVWTQMNYIPPRGQCNHKASIMSPKCPCLRFMLHPLKSSSSYECDGCGHHASFHSMENKEENEIRKKWEAEAREKAEQEQIASERPKKRLREIEYPSNGANDAHAELFGMARGLTASASSAKTGTKKKATAKATAPQRGKKGIATRSRPIELPNEDQDYIDVD